MEREGHESRGSSGFTRALALAAVIHGAIAVAASWVDGSVQRPDVRPARGQELSLVEIEPTVEADEAPPRDPSAPLAIDPARGLAASAATPGPRGDRSLGPAVATGQDGEGSVVAPAPSAEGSASSPAPWIRVTPEQLGLGGAHPFLRPGATGQSGSSDKRAAGVEASMRREADARDRALGLDPAGPAITALEQSTMQSTVPANSNAKLEVVADASGKVTRVRVVSVSEDWAGWQKVAEAAAKALEGKTLRSAGPRGVAMTIAVESRWQLPSGSDPGVEVDIVGVTAKAGEGKRSPRVSILKPRIDLVPVDPDGGLKVPMVSITVLELAGDPTDIGAKPLRTVRAHVVDEERP